MIAASTPKAVLADLLEPVWREEPVETTKTYSLLGARWYAKGLYVKDVKPGSAIQADTLYRVRAGDFVYNRLFAWKGSFAVAEAEHDECYVSNEFPCFVPIDDRVNPRFLLYYLSRETSWNEALGMSTGGTPLSRNRLKEDLFLSLRIPLPDRRDQDRIVATLDAAAARLAEAQRLCREIEEQRHALITSLHLSLAGERITEMSSLMRLDEHAVRVEPAAEYPQIGIRSFGMGLFGKPAMRGINTSYPYFNRVRAGQFLLSQVKGWEGAVGVCPPELDGYFASPEYRTFTCIEGACDPAYLSAIAATTWFHRLLADATRGQGARRERTRPELFLRIKLPMPDFDSQLRGGGAIRRLTCVPIELCEIERELEAVMPSTLDRAFNACSAA